MENFNWKRFAFIVICIWMMSAVLYFGFKINALNWQWWIVILPYSFLSSLAYSWIFPDSEAG